jgi:ribonuclease HII
MEIGIDEAGRGPLAGPVWVGVAVILNKEIDLSPFGDSKTMTERQREAAYDLIQHYAKA